MTKKVLIVVTNADKLADGTQTGVWLEEFAVPFLIFRDTGYEITVASIKGGKAPIDEGSLSCSNPMEWDEAAKFLENTKKLEEVEKCKRLKTSLYEDMKDGILTKEEYLELHEAYLKKAKEGEEIIRQIERDIALILEEKDDKHLWMNYFTEYKDIKELTRDVVVKLICEVRVSENKEVEIVFDFDDCYKQLLESVEKLGYQVDKEPGGQLNISRREAV